MERRNCVCLLTLLILSSCGKPSPADTFHKFGLVGKWAVDCASPPSVENPHRSYASSDGALTIENDLGRFKGTSTVDEAKVDSNGLLHVRLLSDGRMSAGMQKSIFGISSDHVQIISDTTFNKNEDGSVQVIDSVQSLSKGGHSATFAKDGHLVNPETGESGPTTPKTVKCSD